jgi:hypothetical protein
MANKDTLITRICTHEADRIASERGWDVTDPRICPEVDAIADSYRSMTIPELQAVEGRYNSPNTPMSSDTKNPYTNQLVLAASVGLAGLAADAMGVDKLTPQMYTLVGACEVFGVLGSAIVGLKMLTRK